MSGAAGGTRIPRSAVQQTVDDFVKKVLNKIPGFKSAKISGSYNRPVKQDFGDIDLIVSIESEEDKKAVKKYITDYFNSLPDNVMPELKSEKHKGKKAINHGEIVTNLYPILGMPGEFVQIDNIIAISEAEGEFKKTVLDYPAELQGLILGLVKTPMLEEEPQAVLNRMGIKDVPTLGKDQEYEFHVDTAGLSLRIVTLDENFRTLNTNIVWQSSDWNDVKKLLKDFNLDKFEFRDFISKIKQFKNPRSKNRVKGYFKASIKVGPAEAGTPKGDTKQQALDTVASLEERYGKLVASLVSPFLLESIEETTAVFPGKFKPPHKDHLARAQAAAKAADKVIIFIGPKPVGDFTAEQARQIFELYKEKGLLPSNVEVVISDLPSPVLKAYKEFENNPEQKFIAVFGKEDAERFKGVLKLPNVTVNNFPEANIGNLSATDLRNAVTEKNLTTIQTFLPKGVSAEEYLEALQTPLEEAYRGKRTKDGAPGTLKAKITKLYGGDVTIEKAKKLKNRKNATAHDKRQANWFINFHSKNENVIPTEDESAAPYGSGYKEVVEQKLMPHIASLTGYMVENGLSIDDAPEVHFVDDPNNAEELFGRTAFYDPNEKSITLYVTGRHPKDILRSFAHEMIHYCQDCENRLHQTYTTDINEDDRLMELEREAYERGNMYFRSWENSLNENDRKGIKAYSLELVKSLQESKSRYSVPVKELVKKILTTWKDQYEGKEGKYNYSDTAGSLTSKTGNTFYFELDANLKVEKTPGQIYAVEEPTGVDPDVDPEEGDPTFDINIKVDPRDLPKKWPDIYYDLIDIVRHEIEHLTHFGPDAIDAKRLPDDKMLRMMIDAKFLPKADYFKLAAEADAMLQGMALKAKTKKEPFAKTLNDYLDIQIDNGTINQEEKQDILDLWRKRAPALALPKF